MKKLFIHNTIFRICSPIFYGVLVYLLILLVNNNLTDLLKIYSNKELYVCIALSYLSLESVRRAIIEVSKSLDSWPRRYSSLLQILISLSASLLIVYLGVYAYFRWVEGYTVSWAELRIFLFIFGFTALLYNILYFSNAYLLRENTLQLNAEARLREKIEADFAAFRNEINPGFLYESLESILQSLYVNLAEAEEQVDLLASIYRYQLMNRDKELVSFQDEWHALQSLVLILNVRHANKIQLQTKMLDWEKHLVVPGSFLIALEAIVRNTLFSREALFVVSLYDDEGEYLVLHHKLNEKLILHEESLLAFARIQRVYSFFSDTPFVQVKAYGENYIKFPLIKVSENSIVTSEG
jgi:hypothetical protein